MDGSSQARIVSWHAHVYFDPAATRPAAEAVRQGIARRFRVQLGRWHEVPVGPHTAAMYQVAFDAAVFAELVPWLALNRQGLSVLVHPNTLAPRADHLVHALWLGTPLPLSGDTLPEQADADTEPPVLPNTLLDVTRTSGLASAETSKSMDITTLIDTYCQAWSAADESECARLLDEAWSPKATYTDPTVHAEGRAELLAHIAKVMARRPGAKIVRTSQVDQHHRVARFAWRAIEADGRELPEGIDIAFISDEGTKIERILGFFGPVQKRAE